MTTVVYLCVGLLLVAALIRRPQALTVALALSFGLSIIAAQVAEGLHIKPVLMGLDALLVMVAWALWGQHRSTRASIIAWLGLCKILLGIASSFSTPYLVWAAMNNALFVVMILVAGGFTDGIIAWLGRRFLKPDTRGAGVLRYLEPFE